jgi:hypothetical protein
MNRYWISRIAATRIFVALSAVAATAAYAQAHAEVIKPVKVTKPEINGSIFQRKDAVHENKDGNATTDVVTFTSKDNGYQTGLYKSGPLHEADKD